MNYYKRPIWHNPLLYVLVFILLGGIGFVYWSITRPLPKTTITQLAENTDFVLSENTTPTLTKKDGKTRIIDRLTKEEREIKQGEQLPIGDTFKTFEASHATISFGNAVILRLAENSEIEILESAENTITIRQITGKIYHRVEHDSISYAVESTNSRFVAGKSIFSLTSTTESNRIDIVILENEIDAQITKEKIPISTITLQQGTQGTIDTTKALKDIAQFNEINTETLLDDNEWINWNYQQDTEHELSSGILTNNNLPKDIILNGYYENEKVYLDWKLEDGQARNGYRVVMNTEEEPTYPEHTNHFISNNETYNDIWPNLEPGTYHFRVGLYDGTGGILKYSNDVSIIIDNENTINGSIILDVKEDETQAHLSWSVDNIPNIEGYYIISSEDETPTYPRDTYSKVDNQSSSYFWENLDTSKTYYFRVCAIINGNCVNYSNNSQLSFAQEKQGNIQLSGFNTDNSIYLEWNPQDLTSNNLGYRILLSENQNPSLQTSTIKAIDSRATRNYTWNDLARNKTYYLSVCEYIGDNACGVFSNTISITIPAKEVQQGDGTIKITAYYTWGKLHVNWDTINLKAIDGYYIMVSEEPTPTYPNTPFHKLDKSEFYDAWTVDSGKTYYVRACAVVRGVCTVYSNELNVKAI